LELIAQALETVAFTFTVSQILPPGYLMYKVVNNQTIGSYYADNLLSAIQSGSTLLPCEPNKFNKITGKTVLPSEEPALKRLL